jgi:hypothetical protein
MIAMLRETLSRTDVIDLPLVAFVIFFVTFVIVVVRVLIRGKADPRYAALERLPLAADVTTANPPEDSREA